MSTVNGSLGPAAGPRGLLRSYGPIAAAALAFLVMAALVEPIDRPVRNIAAAQEEFEEIDPGTQIDPVTGSTIPGQQATGVPPPSGIRPRGTAPPGATPCTDRAKQVPGDPYSPPCYTFNGNNGGATSRGVTNNEIVITVRELEGPSAAEIFADISGESVDNSDENYRDTALALVEYFSKRFQFYGRKLRLEFFNGEGIGATELLGGGREKALADAVKAVERKAFADLTGLTIPYAAALADKKVINIGAPYPSRKWFVDHRPYTWSLFPDGTNVVEAHSSWITSRLVGRNVEFAGPEFMGKPRKYAVVAPENAEYQESVNAYIERVAGAGFNIALNMKYKLDLSSMPNQASNIIAQLKDAGITSVLCGCDPVMLAIGLTPKANEQSYHPEWITAGLAFVEQDIVAQLIDTDQQSHSFGIAYNAESEPQGRSFPHAAYKTQRPTDEPAFGVEEIYYQLYMLAIGIQMAGPNLTPESFEAGMFAYPGGSGPRGGWGFGPGDYTPMDDFREIWWDPKRISPQNNKPGAWVQLNNGARYRKGQVPKGPAPFFTAG